VNSSTSHGIFKQLIPEANKSSNAIEVLKHLAKAFLRPENSSKAIPAYFPPTVFLVM
jgi:hypothetical protein